MHDYSNEQWRAVPGWEGYYEVSDHGRVRSLPRTVPHGRHGTVQVRGRILRQSETESGHLRVRLAKGGKTFLYAAHRLVLAAFVGPCPEGLEACHNNGNPKDNRMVNLRWDTREANRRDMFDHGTVYQLNKTQCPRGHALEGRNLKPDAVRKGYRTCLACARARNRKSNLRRRHGMEMSNEELQAVADDYYRALIG